MKYKVEKYLNDEPIPSGMARNPRYKHGIKITPALPYGGGLNGVVRDIATASFTDCPFEKSYTVVWLAEEASAELVELVSGYLEEKG